MKLKLLFVSALCLTSYYGSQMITTPCTSDEGSVGPRDRSSTITTGVPIIFFATKNHENLSQESMGSASPPPSDGLQRALTDDLSHSYTLYPIPNACSSERSATYVPIYSFGNSGTLGSKGHTVNTSYPLTKSSLKLIELEQSSPLGSNKTLNITDCTGKNRFACEAEEAPQFAPQSCISCCEKQN